MTGRSNRGHAARARERQRAARRWGPGAQPSGENGMTAASCVLRWGGGAG